MLKHLRLTGRCEGKALLLLHGELLLSDLFVPVNNLERGPRIPSRSFGGPSLGERVWKDSLLVVHFLKLDCRLLEGFHPDRETG